MTGEYEKATIADATITLLNLRRYKSKFVQHLRNKDENEMPREKVADWSDSFDKRIADIVSDHHIIAAFLDPRYRRNDLLYYTQDELEVMFNNTIEKFDHDEEEKFQLIREFKCYYKSIYPYEESMFDRMTAPLDSKTWWNRYFPERKLTKLASFLVTIPASNAAVERSFSHENHLFSQRRQSLKPDTLNKMLKIKFDHASEAGEGKPINVAIQMKELWKNMDIEQDFEEEFPSLEIDCVDQSNATDTDVTNADIINLAE